MGIAAPQVGVNLNLAVIDPSSGEDPAQKLVLINPEIVRTEGSQVGQEGCLSIPGIHEVLERPRKVWVKNRRRDGSWEELVGEDLLARAFCHEIDHLRGKLFVDYFGPVKRQILQRQIQQAVLGTLIVSRIAFLGTPAVAVPALRALASACAVEAVFCNPDQPQGRGRHLEAPPVKAGAPRNWA